jgi:hypothetical protein
MSSFLFCRVREIQRKKRIQLNEVRRKKLLYALDIRGYIGIWVRFIELCRSVKDVYFKEDMEKIKYT